MSKEKIFKLSEFEIEQRPVFTGGLSGKVFRAQRNGDIYYIKSGNLAEVFAEVIFNRLASYCGAAANEAVIIENDVGLDLIDSLFVVATKAVEGMTWNYSKEQPEDILRQYVVLIALKVFMCDDDSYEFILTNDRMLFSIDNSESGLSGEDLRILNGMDFAVKKVDEKVIEKVKSMIYENATNVQRHLLMPSILFDKFIKIFAECNQIELFLKTLKKLSVVSDQVLNEITEDFSLLYDFAAVDYTRVCLKRFRENINLILESYQRH